MERLLYTLLMIGFAYQSMSQQPDNLANDNYIRIIPGSLNSQFNRLELQSDMDTTWDKWTHRGYSFGFNQKLTPMYTTIN